MDMEVPIMLNDIPLLLLATTVCTYWSTVLLLVVVKRLRHGRSAGLVPKQRYERRLWRLILPVVGSWIALPILALTGAHAWLELPELVHANAWLFWARAVAAGFGVTCYLLSVYCWLLMGRSWSMAIVPGQSTGLVTTGIYGWVRHPIYSLSIGLMLASVVVLPTLPMAVLACLHLLAFNLKARHEEQHLQASFGESYVRYCRHAGRFFPRLTGVRSRDSQPAANA
jgi:protein-S-isoprenylcysteine O-methyltransferase Ste14